MRESYWWLLGAFITTLLACVLILLGDLLPSGPFVVEMLATLFGVLIAITLGEAFGANRDEMRAKWVEKELVEELSEVLALAKRDDLDELHSATWTAIKGTGIPDRIDPRVRRALADAFSVFDIYNYEVRKYKESSFTCDPDDPRLVKLGHHISETKQRLVSAAQIVLDLMNS
ncbi:MAG: hypothetical protein ACW98U_04430 [Candidatus Thorarchaeota archaeon]|jgi:hypothetical protein